MEHVTRLRTALLETIRHYVAGEVPLRRVFFRDMLIFGSLINVVTGGAALIAYASDAPDHIALAIFLSPVPYNIALCICVWRSAAHHPSGWADFARIGSVLWLLMFLVI